VRGTKDASELTVIAFGPWLGFAYGMTGLLVSAYATYYAGRLLKPRTVSRLGIDVSRHAARRARPYFAKRWLERQPA